MIKPDARFLRRFGSALFGWLSLFELLAALFGLRGLLLTHPQVWCAVGWLLVWHARHLRRSGTAGWLTLLPALLPALLLHLLLATLRNRQLDPRRRLLPGSYADREITRLDVPTATGPVPALHIVPVGGTHAAVCVAHGSGCNKTFYAWELVDALLARGLALLLIDLDGHGESCRPQAFPDIVQNIVGPVAWLRARYERVGVIGNSLGGCVAARAVADGTAVDALVLLEAPPWLQLSRRQVAREVVGLLQPAIVRLTRAGSPYWIARAWESPRIRARIGTRELIDALDLPGSLRRITAGGLPATGYDTDRLPLLLIYGAWDAIVSPQQAAQVRQAVPPGGTFHLLRYATHLSLPIDPRTLALVGHRLEAALRQ
jgi:alpha-beta hydrolase superfamily lysophospholipase